MSIVALQDLLDELKGNHCTLVQSLGNTQARPGLQHHVPVGCLCLSRERGVLRQAPEAPRGLYRLEQIEEMAKKI